MSKQDLVVLSPRLGCPQFMPLRGSEPSEPGFLLVLAARENLGGEAIRDRLEGKLFLAPSGSNGGGPEFALEPADPEEILNPFDLIPRAGTDWTRELISDELHQNVLGGDVRYWRVTVRPSSGSVPALPRREGGEALPLLCDLILSEGKDRTVHPHALQIIEGYREDFRFLHITDLHLAARNDVMLREILQFRHGRTSGAITGDYKNFNDNLRRLIRRINEMTEQGEMDFVLIGGDIVDFVFHGWEEDDNVRNNWRTFVDIITGGGAEAEARFSCPRPEGGDPVEVKGNPGLRVAAFTTTGNHDWRLHPYSPSFPGYSGAFGLKREEAASYQYRYFESLEEGDDRRRRMSEKIQQDILKQFNLDLFTDKLTLKLSKYLSSRLLRLSFPLLGLGGAFFNHLWILDKMKEITEKYVYSGLVFVLVWLALWGLKKFIERRVENLADLLVDNPLHADVRGLHYYFQHINPYFNYAFAYGPHRFLMMDTGCDLFNGQLLDRKEAKNMKRMSIKDNVLGGSPDSRAFDSEKRYYRYTQTAWMDTLLNGQEPEVGEGTAVLCLHAPPVNPDGKVPWNRLWEENRPGQKWISRDEQNLTFGSIAHYLSQFFYLCLGYREGDWPYEPERKGRGVQLILSGHAHRNLEFRLEMGDYRKEKFHIYSSVYSQRKPADPEEYWRRHSPLIVQTGACGLSGKFDEMEPYFRLISMGRKGIKDFRVYNLLGEINFTSGSEEHT